MSELFVPQNRWGKIHANALTIFLDTLNQNKINWLIIRNYEGLPEINNSNDIDIVIEKKQWKAVHKILVEVFTPLGFEYYTLNKFQFIRCYTFFHLDGISFKLDLFDCNEYIGLETHSFDNLNKEKALYNNKIYIASPLHQAVIIWLRPLLGAKFVKEKYLPEIVTYYNGNKELFLSEIIRLFGKGTAKKVLVLFDKNKISDTVKLRKQLIISLFFKLFIKNPIVTVFRLIKHYILSMDNKFWPLIFKKAKFIAVIGADGSGKSTFISGLRHSMAHYYATDINKSREIHFRPTILPNLGAVGEKAGVMKEDKDFTNPHRGKPTGFISSLIRMMYYWLDYFIGVPLLLRKDAAKDRYTIYDRYIYDFLIDPCRSRINLPYWVRKAYTKLVVQPRIVFVLLTDAETIYKRKQELTIDEINRQLGAFKKLAKSHKRFIVIDASLSPEEMVEQAMKLVIKKFTHKII